MTWHRAVVPLIALTAVLALTGCAITIPADPDGTLDRIEGGELRVGVSIEPGLIELDDAGTGASGPLADLVEQYAASHDADVVWTPGSEESLVLDLEEGRIDLAAGGMTSATGWVDRVGVTRGYPGIPGADGRDLVLFVPLGENAFLSDLERFLDAEAGA